MPSACEHDGNAISESERGLREVKESQEAGLALIRTHSGIEAIKPSVRWCPQAKYR